MTILNPYKLDYGGKVTPDAEMERDPLGVEHARLMALAAECREAGDMQGWDEYRYAADLECRRITRHIPSGSVNRYYSLPDGRLIAVEGQDVGDPRYSLISDGVSGATRRRRKRRRRV